MLKTDVFIRQNPLLKEEQLLLKMEGFINIILAMEIIIFCALLIINLAKLIAKEMSYGFPGYGKVELTKDVIGM